ncbi:hypothetical protein [Flyfo microvirus Tbat2_98]|nr:hypothetical protein [Flyfo microvirus Tbat2_98]
MKRVGDLTLFQPIAADAIATFPSDRERTVRISVNAPGNVLLYVVPLTDEGDVDEDVRPMFLATVNGLEDVEFYAHGPFGIQGDGDFGLKTLDGQPVHAIVPDAMTFTRIAERRPRNLEVERLQAMLMQNQERRMGAMYEELRIEREKLQRERTAVNNQRASADAAAQSKPEPSADGGASAENDGKTKQGKDASKDDKPAA